MSVNQIIEQVLQNMIDTENTDFRLSKQGNILELIERDELLVMERLWPQRRVNMVEFIKIMISVVHHKQCELLYLVMGLIELFKDIVAACQQNELSLSDVTSYVCQVEPITNNIVPQMLIPEPKKFELNKSRIRDIDVNAPRIIGQADGEICHIVNGSLINDAIRHHNNNVHTGQVCMKQIVTLDSLDSKLNIYNLDGTLKNQVKINQSEDKETIILSFAWSDRQQRIGLTLKSHSLCMYESDFKTFRIFPTVYASQDYQTNIWYLENQNKWITTDATFKLYEWDLQTENVANIYSTNKISGCIIDCVEVVHMKMIATASLDKQVVVWDLNTKDIKIVVSLKEHGGIHSLIYSYYYQIFITCGYSTYINVYEINPKFHDVTMIGKLSGHTSMLTSIQMIGRSPVLISGDDGGTLRLWDIRTFSCLQSLNFGRKTQITKLLDLSDQSMICFLGSRVNLLKLDIRKKDQSDNYVIKIDFDPQRDELIVASKKNIIFMDIQTGRMKRILNGLLNELEDEITQFRPLNYYNKFILSDSKGNLKIYFHTGEFFAPLKGHSDVLQLKLDILNKLIITSGHDSVQIQKMNAEILREITPFKSQHLEISVHHSLLLASYMNHLYIFDYEFIKCLSFLEFDGDITSIIFIANYPLFAVSTITGRLYIMKFIVKDHIEVKTTVHQIYEVANCSNYVTEEGEQEFITKIVLSVKELELAMVTSENNIIRLQLNISIEPTQPVHERINYNPLRKAKEQVLITDPIHISPPQGIEKLKHIITFNASKKQIVSLSYLQLDNRFLLITSIDGIIKIFDLNGELIAAYNINHPLPIKWDIKYTKQSELKKRIIYGFKVIDILRKQSKTEKEAEIYSLTDSLSVNRQNSLSLQSLNKKPLVMKDEFSPRDLKFDKIRHLYQNEVQGPTLKQMEAQRRLQEVQNMFKNDIRDPKLDEVLKLREKERQKNLDRAANLNFLDPEFRDKSIFNQKLLSKNEYLKEFNTKLDNNDQSSIILRQYQSNQNQQSQVNIQTQNKKKQNSSSDFYKYAAQRHLLNEASILESFTSQNTQFKPINKQQINIQSTQISQLKSFGSQDLTWHGQHRKQQKDLSQVLTSLNIKLRQSKNSLGGETILRDITKSDITFEDQLDEFTKKHKLK
ncbi:unnamed protein product [Paramecium sonneborni]|uniref:Uncharacterized protein n=1 Tax=Paramecium sonneborni TaxID=65129 RepID=A0A8S1P6S2_9CILI|nr:unnamed protein product [Paramecium sonneborni]